MEFMLTLGKTLLRRFGAELAFRDQNIIFSHKDRKDRQVFNCEKQEGKKTYRFIFFAYFVTFVVKILALTINMNG